MIVAKLIIIQLSWTKDPKPSNQWSSQQPIVNLKIKQNQIKYHYSESIMTQSFLIDRLENKKTAL